MPTLDIENFGLSTKICNQHLMLGRLSNWHQFSENILIHLERIYCDSIGIEYMYIRTPERIKWIQGFLNKKHNHPEFNNYKKTNTKKLIQASSFESFLQKSLLDKNIFEGGESLIPLLDSIFGAQH